MKTVFRTGIGCLALALLISSTVPALRVSASADTNADNTIDVRDVQFVGTALLAQSQSCTAADVNRDGRVDILDFQQVVSEAASASSGTTPTTPAQQPRNAPSAPVHELLALKTAATAAVSFPEFIAPAHCGRLQAPLAPRHARLQRLGLAAHAPPLA